MNEKVKTQAKVAAPLMQSASVFQARPFALQPKLEERSSPEHKPSNLFKTYLQRRAVHLKNNFGHLSHSPLQAGSSQGQNSKVIQRAVDQKTLNNWMAVTKKNTKIFGIKLKEKQSKQHEEVAELIDTLTRTANIADREFNLSKLKRLVDKLLEEPRQQKYREALLEVKRDIESEKPLTKEQIRQQIDPYIDDIFNESSGDLANKELKTLRLQMLINQLESRRITEFDIGEAKRWAQKGIIEGQWIARGLCQDACQAYGRTAREIQPRSGGSTITWNHYILDDGKTFTDRTWKQFFKLEDTEGKPPIFKGTAQDFLQLGLPEEDVINYLKFIGKYSQV